MEIDNDVSPRELLYAHPDHAEFQAGSAEPWIANVLAALVVANDTHTAIEIGGFQGFTSKRIARALAKLPHPTKLIVCEIDEQRALTVADALLRDEKIIGDVFYRVVIADSLAWLPTLSDESVNFGWLDGNHEKAHVAREIELLWPKLSIGGIAAFHDVFGVTDLQEVVKAFGGYSLDLPKLGPAGGLGLLQRRE